jgi:electron transfer flavoprotein alpha subunit
MNKNLLLPFLGVLASLFLFSCVKDTDFNQAENITLTPVVELDLIYFNVEAGAFFDSVTNTSILTISDTTEIRFLDDSGVQESLVKAEFLFNFTNSIPRTFEVVFQFLSEENEETYLAQTTVEQGTELAPVVSQFLETIEGEDITRLTMADKVVVSVTIPSSNANLSGTLDLKSKTTYYLEIKERS